MSKTNFRVHMKLQHILSTPPQQPKKQVQPSAVTLTKKNVGLPFSARCCDGGVVSEVSRSPTWLETPGWAVKGLSETLALCSGEPWHRRDTWQLSHRVAQCHYHPWGAEDPEKGTDFMKITKDGPSKIKLEWTAVCDLYCPLLVLCTSKTISNI